MAAKILIVDDDIDTLHLVGTMLERQGYQILAANNGMKAIDTAQRERPSLILLDIMMPGMDGYEVTRRLRNIETTSSIPIIMFTAKVQVDDKVEGFEAGADDYLTKPIHPAELISRVKKILTRPKADSLVIEDSVEQENSGQMIGVIAAKAGLGISTLAINLGVSILQQTGTTVTVAEFRPGQGDIGIYLGYAKPEKLNELLTRPAVQIRLEDVESRLVKDQSGIQLLLSSYDPADVNYQSAHKQFESVAKFLGQTADHVILDLGVGLPESTQNILKLCDDIVVVIEPTRHAISKTNLLLQGIEQIGIPKNRIRVVLINRVRLEITVPANQLAAQLGYPLAGVLTPAPELVYQSVSRHEPLVLHQPNSLIVNQINKLAGVLLEKGSSD